MRKGRYGGKQNKNMIWMLGIFFFWLQNNALFPFFASQETRLVLGTPMPVWGYFTEEVGIFRQGKEQKEMPKESQGIEDESQLGEEWTELVQAMEAENKSQLIVPPESQSQDGQEVQEPSPIEELPFVPREKSNTYDWTALEDYATLVSTFYAVDAGTMIGSNQLDVELLLGTECRVSKEDSSPQILIYHTHSLEGYADSREGERQDTVVGIGEHLAEILQEKYGYGVLHHTEEYDTVRDQAYAKSLPALEQVLQDNPSIQVIIDLHRDAGLKNGKRVTEIDGKQMATFMLFNGLSRTRKTGDIFYLKNPNLQDNLGFSFQMQVKAGEYYPGLTRKIYLKAYRYNMHLLPLTLLIELGDENNTVEEAMNTCEPLAHILDMVLSGT